MKIKKRPISLAVSFIISSWCIEYSVFYEGAGVVWWLAGGKFIYFKVKLLWLSHQITGGEEMISTLKLFFLFFIREQVNDKVYYFILFFFLLNKQFCFSYFLSIFLTQEMKVNLYVHTYIQISQQIRFILFN